MKKESCMFSMLCGGKPDSRNTRVHDFYSISLADGLKPAFEHQGETHQLNMDLLPVREMRRKEKQLSGMRQARKRANCFIHKKTSPANE
jgi:hypothetical protein